MRQLIRRHVQRQKLDHQADEIPPRLIGMGREGRRFGSAQDLDHLLLRGGHGGRERLHQPESVKVSVSLVRRAVQDDERVDPEAFEGIRGHLRRDARMPVAVAAGPTFQNRTRGDWPGASMSAGSKAGGLPCRTEPRMESRKDGGENVAQVVKYVPALVAQLRLREQDFAGAPQPLEAPPLSGPRGAWYRKG